MRRHIITAALAITCATSVGFAATADTTQAPAGTHIAQLAALQEATAKLPTNQLQFSGDNVFQRDLRQAPVDPNSSAMVADLVNQVKGGWGGEAVINSDQYANTRVTATPSTPKVDLNYVDCQHKGTGMPPEIKPAMTGVPIPANAVPSKGTDAQLSVYDPATKKLWEFWGAAKDANGNWSACWAGMLEASSSNGQFPGTTGVSASGLAMAGMSPTLKEMATGVAQQISGTADPNRPAIDHALYLAVVKPAPWNNYVWPAVRSDGPPDGGALPEGARLRLKPGTDTNHLPPLARAFAQTAQIYGFIVADKAATVNVSVQTADTDDTSPLIKSAFQILYQGADPWHQLDGFPWDQLEVVDTKDQGRSTPPLLTPDDGAPSPAPSTPTSSAPTSTPGPSSPTPSAPEVSSPATTSPAPTTSQGAPSPTGSWTSPPTSGAPSDGAPTPAPSWSPSSPSPSSTSSWGSSAPTGSPSPSSTSPWGPPTGDPSTPTSTWPSSTTGAPPTPSVSATPTPDMSILTPSGTTPTQPSDWTGNPADDLPQGVRDELRRQGIDLGPTDVDE